MIRFISVVTALGLLLVAPSALAGGSGDVNGDGAVNVEDVEMAAGALNTAEGDSDFLAEADVDGDGAISLSDVGQIRAAAGQ